mmetsp:Transcript_36577/g.85842  ORF Transcript_36577/g.85842 Transcript_36577/m.85842 type:complete len:192 (+) Transcript_36577:404-979(+)
MPAAADAGTELQGGGGSGGGAACARSQPLAGGAARRDGLGDGLSDGCQGSAGVDQAGRGGRAVPGGQAAPAARAPHADAPTAADGAAAGAMASQRMFSALRRWPSVGSGSSLTTSRTPRLPDAAPGLGYSLTASRCARTAALGVRLDGAAPPQPLPTALAGTAVSAVAGAAQMRLRTANPFARPARPPSAP